MNRVPDEYEVVDGPQPWVSRNPGVALSILIGGFAAVQIIGEVWIDDMQQPRWDKIDRAIGKLSQENRQLATFQLETSRYIGLALTGISESANVVMPDKPEALKRAAERVRDIQERVN